MVGLIDQRVRFVTFRQKGHLLSRHSGYDVVTQYGGTVIRARPLPRAIMPSRLMWRIADGVIAYDWEALATEIKTGFNLLGSRGCTYHILYAENTYHYLGFLNRVRGNQLIATFHLPTWKHHELVRVDWHIRQLSAVICVGHTQLEFFTRLLGRDRTFFVPHGVDAEYFSPPDCFETREPNLCVFIGDHLRDVTTLKASMALIMRQRAAVRFIVVTTAPELTRDAPDSRVTLRSNIPEPELLQLYRTASVLLMPLTDTTANNAVLEAMACGLPMVATDVGSIGDYVSPAGAVLVPPNNPEHMAAAVIQLLDDAPRRRALSAAARQQALTFAWPEVVRHLQAVYAAVA